MIRSVNIKKKWRKLGRIIRLSLFILNGSIWVLAILAIVGSMIIGFYTRSITLQGFDFYDFWLSTPVTVVLYYGVVIVSCTMVGCFVGTGGRIWACVTYCSLLLLLAILDGSIGIQFFYNKGSLYNFLDEIHKSMWKYHEHTNATIGIFSINVQTYWDHMQSQMHCCGWNSWDEWKDTPIGEELDLPDSCCNEKYRHDGCGSDLLLHSDSESHRSEDVIHTKSCTEAYPKKYLESFTEASLMGIFIAIALLICFLLSLVLFILNITRIYEPGKNIYPDPKKGKNKTLIIDPNQEKPNTELILPESEDSYEYDENLNSRRIVPRIVFKKNNKVEPLPQTQ